jgi:transcription-repair coupling factor (superfamily II helicase)
VALFRAHARKVGLTEVLLQGNYVRFAPVDLRESQDMKLQRLYPKTLVKAPAQQILVPKPMTARIGGKPLRDAAVLDWAWKLIDAVLEPGK